MQANSIAGYVGGTGIGQIPNQTLASTTETEFQQNLTASTTGIAVLSVPGSQTTAQYGGGPRGHVPPLNPDANAAKIVDDFGVMFRPTPPAGFSSSSFDNGRPFLITLCGLITPVSNGANSLAINLYCGTSKSGTKIASTGTNTGTETSTQAGSFVLQALLFWDSTSQFLAGQQWYSVQAGATPLYNTWKATTQATSVALAGLQFCASAVWGNAAGGQIQVQEFSLSRQ